MNTIFKVFLILHVIGGSLGLFSGMINIIRRKGDKNHKIVGKVFFVSMLAAGISSLILSYLHPNSFLFMVGVFTLYMVSSGQRYLTEKQINNFSPNIIDWTITILMCLAGLLFVILGASAILKSNLFGVVYIVFGGLGLLFVGQDYINYNNKSRIKNYRLLAHLQRMTGSFIAALTAFLVVNAKYLPDVIPSILYWLLPTLVLTPYIIHWSLKYQTK